MSHDRRQYATDRRMALSRSWRALAHAKTSVEAGDAVDWGYVVGLEDQMVELEAEMRQWGMSERDWR